MPSNPFDFRDRPPARSSRNTLFDVVKGSGAVHAALGADDDLEYLVRRLRQAWPGVHIQVRGDAGYGMPWMYRVCERLKSDYGQRSDRRRGKPAGDADERRFRWD